MSVHGATPNVNLYSLNNDVGQKKNESQLKETVNKTQSSANRLIFLTGTSTAGKSAIMTAFTQHGENAMELGVDDFDEGRWSDSIKQHFPEDYDILSRAVNPKDFFKFMNSPLNKLLFKDESSPEERAVATKLHASPEFYMKIRGALAPEHFQKILSFVKYKTIVFDTPNAQDFFKFLKDKHCDVPIQRFLVYASLTTLVDRISKRNAESVDNEVNKRRYVDVLRHFKDQYRKAEPNEIQVDTLRKGDITTVFKQHSITIGAENSDSDEQYQITEKKFLEHFGLDPSDSDEKTVSITTNEIEKFQGIFRTTTQSADEIAKQLNEHKWIDLSKDKGV